MHPVGPKLLHKLSEGTAFSSVDGAAGWKYLNFKKNEVPPPPCTHGDDSGRDDTLKL